MHPMADRVDRFSSEWREAGFEDDVWRLAIWGRLKVATTLLDRLVVCCIAGYGLQLGEWEVLAALRRSNAAGELTATELLNALIVSAGTITNRVDRLESAGLVRRWHHHSDGRVVVIRMTQKGRQVFDRAFADVRAALARVMEPARGHDTELSAVLRELTLTFESEVQRLSGDGSP